MTGANSSDAVLLLDTCGEVGSVALFRAQHLVREVRLPERAASVALLGAIRALLGSEGLAVRDLDGLGVVHGPGSFTGVRVGLAVAKGICEAIGRPLAAVSRLAVLGDKGLASEGYAVLAAGRNQVYVREVEPGGKAREFLATAAELLDLAGTLPVAYTEASVPPLFADHPGLRPVEISAQDAWPRVQACLRTGGSDLSRVDANYVRDEQAIYARRAGVP